ncbi:hypothetical protein ABZ352_18620 [Streptomyces griseofuscus]|uniref:hypothetical protein n=1 Tax=Streptomyces griseofuscus TaxID=146922 RepID=UPI003406579D
MIPSETRLALIDRATDLVGAPGLSPATLTAFIRHLRRGDLDVSDWHRCDDLAASGRMTHHQARTAVAQLVQAGLMERDVVPRRVERRDRRYTAYRLTQAAVAGAER